ncbi:hypothetical protein AVEN_57419-1 [Araneus ventricosus]|uniref:Helitron helicase-like domain-containing protein n=1 Tax=Araneus ventricosus TaxID=182803 RepID=A0A4Y2CYE9_ARAVE|nr:hypothetical protein AVEN_57419-1 [Araneus ventricosus]
MGLQYLYYNLRLREQSSNESLDETLQRRSARNEADRLRRAGKRSDQLSQQRENRILSQIEALNEATEENVNGYPIYQRRARGPVKFGIHEMDNRWIVPYNTWLIKKFSAHINVEVRSSVKSVKCLYKCVYEGHDAASIILQSNDGLLKKSYVIMRLAVHLPNQQQVVFQIGQEVAAVARASMRHTTLTA